MKDFKIEKDKNSNLYIFYIRENEKITGYMCNLAELKLLNAVIDESLRKIENDKTK